MAFLVRDLAVALTDEDEDRGWGVLIACGAKSLDDDGCGPNTQKDTRLDPVDLLWGAQDDKEQYEEDLRTLLFLLAQATAEVERRIASLPPEEETGASE